MKFSKSVVYMLHFSDYIKIFEIQFLVSSSNLGNKYHVVTHTFFFKFSFKFQAFISPLQFNVNSRHKYFALYYGRSCMTRRSSQVNFFLFILLRLTYDDIYNILLFFGITYTFYNYTLCNNLLNFKNPVAQQSGVIFQLVHIFRNLTWFITFKAQFTSKKLL